MKKKILILGCMGHIGFSLAKYFSQKKYNVLWYYTYREDRGWIGRKIYDYAHNDWVQFLADYGIAGCAFILLMFGLLLCSSFSAFYYRISAGLISLFGLLLIAIHNFVDFIFSCPAYWIAFWCSLFLIYKLFDLELKERSR